MHDGDNPVKGLPFLNGYLYGEFPNLVAEGASTIQPRPFIWSPENISTLVGLVKKLATFIHQISTYFNSIDPHFRLLL